MTPVDAHQPGENAFLTDPNALVPFMAPLPHPVLFLLFLPVHPSLIYSPRLPSRPNSPTRSLFVMSPNEAGCVVSAEGDPTLDGVGEVAPDKPVAMAWYAHGSIARAGELRESKLKVLQEEYPLAPPSKNLQWEPILPKLLV